MLIHKFGQPYAFIVNQGVEYKLNTEIINTNDIVKLYSETEFEIIGRFDNIINSGGLKLFPEQI